MKIERITITANILAADKKFGTSIQNPNILQNGILLTQAGIVQQLQMT
jgi:hypothetical protein